MNGDGASKEIISCHAGWRSPVYLRRVRSLQNADVRGIRDVLDVAPVKKVKLPSTKLCKCGGMCD